MNCKPDERFPNVSITLKYGIGVFALYKIQGLRNYFFFPTQILDFKPLTLLLLQHRKQNVQWYVVWNCASLFIWYKVLACGIIFLLHYYDFVFTPKHWNYSVKYYSKMYPHVYSDD